MTRWIVSAIGILALVSFTAPGAVAELPDTPAVVEPASDKCAPPCGYIYPIISLTPDVAFPYDVDKLSELPSEIHIKVTYSWDFDQDGTGIPGDAEDMEVTLALTKKPDWLDAKLDPLVCSFTLIPTTYEYEVCEVTLANEVVDVPMTEADLDLFGKRMMVFATSKESGMFKQSYGVEDMRFDFDDAGTSGTDEIAEAPLGLIAPLVAVGAAGLALRRRLA